MTESVAPGAPFETLGEDRPGRWLVTCDHATNIVPPWVNGGDLGLPEEDMARHIAYDPGAAGVTRALAELLNSPAILTRFSRLVIDPNRGEDDPTLIMKLYDGSLVPANARLTRGEREARLERLYRPYHQAYADLAARRRDVAILAIHSYTPQLRGRPPRPWHIGVLSADEDRRLAEPFIRRLSAESGLCVGDNEPYGGHLPGDSIDRHCLVPGRPNLLVELRNDLIQTADQQRDWAERLAPALQGAAEQAEV
ncbi:N-formylglutamate amidohydrolase [Pseudoroseicyclus tamaricis]|uniref:N-formylglutamate amidohydrolase n=1 Tax=Pseudoroseicyclus tamaricis TaxID=2705421 RepID=A0A6B2JTC3_9RHOB|nr:N-formylglutamate amidohydrolase [Pseudoroseicyclus tamaricis]NDU99423.1 N-formylglutamate amidohydrolase [Pseudoroseicyclus tamaricis]